MRAVLCVRAWHCLCILSSKGETKFPNHRPRTERMWESSTIATPIRMLHRHRLFIGRSVYGILCVWLCLSPLFINRLEKNAAECIPVQHRFTTKKTPMTAWNSVNDIGVSVINFRKHSHPVFVHLDESNRKKNKAISVGFGTEEKRLVNNNLSTKTTNAICSPHDGHGSLLSCNLHEYSRTFWWSHRWCTRWNTKCVKCLLVSSTPRTDSIVIYYETQFQSRQATNQHKCIGIEWDRLNIKSNHNASAESKIIKYKDKLNVTPSNAGADDGSVCVCMWI